ncbi:MAG: RNA polymerase sigma factor [Acidobacteriota bacterium]
MAAQTLVGDVLLAQSGDHEALDRLLRAVQLPVFRFVRATIGRGRDPEDIVQDALLLVCRKLKWLDNPEAFQAWTFQIAWRVTLRALSRAERREMTSEEIRRFEITEEAANMDPWLAGALHNAIAGLSPAIRPVIELHYIEGLTLTEIAAALALPLGTVKSRLALGLKQLRAELGSRGTGRQI